MIKFNKWALAFANTVLVFHVVGMAALYFWGEKAINFVEKFQLVRFSNEALTLQTTIANFIFGTVWHYVFAYVFVALVIYLHDRK